MVQVDVNGQMNFKIMWVIFVPELGFYAGRYALEQFTETATMGYAEPKNAERDLEQLKSRYPQALILSPGALYHKTLHPNWLPKEDGSW